MNQLTEITQAFAAGRLTKPAFVEAMYGEHARLFDYQRRLADVNIAQIKIGPDGVAMQFRDPAVWMGCPENDVRIAPVEAFNFGNYEAAEVQAVRRIIGLLGGAAVRLLDIGANAGFYSLALAHYFPGLRGEAFEPIPTTFTQLQRNLALNGVTHIRPHNLGLSDRDGELVFYTYASQSGASSMTRNLDSPDAREVRCAVRRLDDLGAAADFIKCDVEGAELFVFRGAEKLLARDRPAIFTEMLRKWCANYHYHPNDIISFLGQHGYQCHVIHGDRLRACATVTEQTVETNFLFLHRERHAGPLATLAD